MKKIILLVFILFSIIFVSINQTHAVTVDNTYIEPNRAVFEYNEPNMQYAHYIWDFYSSVNDTYYQNLGLIGYYATSDTIRRVYSFRSDVSNYIQFYYPSFQQIELPDLQYLIIEYVDSSNTSFTFYNNSGIIIEQFDYYDITNGYPNDYNIFIGYRVNTLDSDAYDAAYDAGAKGGYNLGRQEYGHYDNNNYITADDYGSSRYNAGLNEGRGLFGKYYGNNWLTANQWGDIEFDRGYDKGLSNEIDWFSWSMTFFLMPFRVLNIQVLPGVRIGYFALFSLLLGVVGWFFFIVGKGGGRKK